eukprot:UN0956
MVMHNSWKWRARLTEHGEGTEIERGRQRKNPLAAMLQDLHERRLIRGGHSSICIPVSTVLFKPRLAELQSRRPQAQHSRVQLKTHFEVQRISESGIQSGLRHSGRIPFENTGDVIEVQHCENRGQEGTQDVSVRVHVDDFLITVLKAIQHGLYLCSTEDSAFPWKPCIDCQISQDMLVKHAGLVTHLRVHITDNMYVELDVVFVLSDSQGP